MIRFHSGSVVETRDGEKAARGAGERMRGWMALKEVLKIVQWHGGGLKCGSAAGVEGLGFGTYTWEVKLTRL
jgi:hypothetical protein